MNTTPEVIGDYRLTFELFKDGDTTAYWSKNRVSNPYCCFASTTTVDGHEYTGWESDTAAVGAPPVPGEYVIKVTLTDTQQNPIDTVDAFIRSFTITGTSGTEDMARQYFKILHYNNQLHIKTTSPEKTLVSVYNLNGALQLQKEFYASEIVLNTEFKTGIYLVKVVQGANTGNHKFFVK